MEIGAIIHKSMFFQGSVSDFRSKNAHCVWTPAAGNIVSCGLSLQETNYIGCASGIVSAVRHEISHASDLSSVLSNEQ